MHEMVGPVDGQIDLQVKDWQPHKPKPDPGFIMQDPKRQPRFEKVKIKPENEKPFDPDAPLSPLINYDYLKAKEPALVNMSKMRGRRDEDTGLEDAIIQEMEGEGIDRAGNFCFI